jgi:DNA-binding response OmpR family regulator
LKILIADDDPSTREALRATLTRWGHDLVICADGDEAWQALQAEDAPKLAILDWMMPEMEGIEVCRKVREMSPSRLVYILLLTARERREDIMAGLQAGADDYVTKPFDRGELQTRLRVGIRVVGLQERLLEAERVRVLTETAGGTAHEINQPLCVVLGKTDMLLSAMAADDPHRRYAEDIYKAGEKIDEIVRNMRAVRQYATRPYIRGINILDFDGAAGGKRT